MFALPKTVAMFAMVLITALAATVQALGGTGLRPAQDRRDAIPRGTVFEVLDITTGSSSTTSSSSVAFTVTFNREPANFDNAGAVIVTTTESLTYTMITFGPPSPNSVDVTFEGLEGEGDLSFEVSTASGIMDTLGSSLAVGGFSPVVLVDRLPPRTMATGPTGTIYQFDDPTFEVTWVAEENGVGLESVELFWSRSTTPFGFTNFQPYDFDLFNTSPINVETGLMPGTGNYFAFYTTGIGSGFFDFEDDPPSPDIIVYFKSLSTSEDILIGADSGCFKCLPGEEPGPGARGKGFFIPSIVDIDPLTGAVISSRPIIFLYPDHGLEDVGGMDQHPDTGELWLTAFIFPTGGQGRDDRGTFGYVLLRGDAATGEVQYAGYLPDEFDSVAFTPDGTLYGITSRFASSPNTMYRLDMSGADNHVQLFAVSNGNGSTGLHAFDWMTSPTLFMNVSGGYNFGMGTSNHLVEFIDPSTGPTSSLLPGGADFFRADGATTLADWLYVMSTDGDLYRTDELGNFDFIGFTGGDVSGLATGKNPDLCPVYLRNHVVDDSDSSFGNANGAVDPGETIGLYLGLRNEFGQNATGITAWLEDCTSPSITLISDTSTYPDLMPTEEQFNDMPFIVEVPFGQPCTTLSFKLHVTTDLTSCTIPITIPMGASGTMAIGESFDIEGPQSDWQLTGQWRFAVDDQCTTPTPLYSSPLTSLSCNADGFCQYSNGLFATAEIDRSYLITSGPNPSEFSFMHNLQTESGYDFASVEASSDGGQSWFTIWEFESGRGSGGPARGGSGIGTGGLWEPVTVSLEPYDSQTLQFRFLFTSDGSVTYRGWYVDDVAIVTNERLCEPFEPLLPCPTGTPVPTPTPTATPTATATPTMTPAPSPTPPVFVPAVFSVEGLPGEIRATHSGVANTPLRHFVAFWSREANLQANRWRYEGFVEYQNGEQTTSIPWKAPTTGKRFEFAARLFIEGTGYSGPFVYGILTDLPKQFPDIASVVYDDSSREIVVSFDPVGGLTCSIGIWRRHIFVPPAFPETSATALGNWQYLGVTPYPLNTSVLRIPYDRGSNNFEMAFAVWIKGAGFVLPYTFQIAPSEATVYPNLHTILPVASQGKVSTSFSPVGNQPAKVGLWFRERGGRGGCDIVCDWTFFDLYDYSPLTREIDFPWFPANPKNRYDIAMRVYTKDMFGALAPTAPFVYYTLCDVSGDPPQLPTPSPTVSPTPTASPTSTATPTPTVTPTATPTGTGIAADRR